MQPPANSISYTNKPSHRLRSLVILSVWLVILAGVALNRQAIFDRGQDWWQLRNYQPPAVIAQLASQDTMTDLGRKLFYVNHPVLADKPTFARVCPSGGEQTIVLGCYHGNQAGIWLLDVNDPRLEGVKQVTSAHEMLHAAYDRLSPAERQKVDGLLMDYYQHDLHDQRLLATIGAYKKSEPKDVANEMHSIFGTEVANLPPQLETYYKRYFANRAQVAAYAAQYQEVFTSRDNVLKRQKLQLDDLQAQFDALQADLKTKQSAINTMKAQLNSDRSSGDVVAYNAGVPAYNNLINQYNQQVEELQNLSQEFNSLRQEYNALVLEQSQLTDELKSDVPTINKTINN